MKALDLDFLKSNAYNLRWAELPDGVIPFTAADWDLPSDKSIEEAITASIAHRGFPYGSGAGLPAFRKALATHFNEHKNTEISANQTLACNSAAAAIQHLYNYLLKAGDEILLPDPVDFLLAECAHRMNVRVVRFSQQKEGINLQDLQNKITPNTKALVICNPHNPNGYVLQKNDLQQLHAFCQTNSLQLISDEVWSDIVHYSAPFHSAAFLNLNTWVVYGFSKGFGLAGLRIGAIIAPSEDDIQKIMKHNGYDRTIEGASTLSQQAAIAAMQYGWNNTLVLRQLFLENLELAAMRINTETVCTCEAPSGTFVMSIRHPNHWNTELFCQYALDTHKIAVVPGLEKWFGKGANKTFRISLATTQAIATEGLERLVRAIQSFESTL